VNDMSFLKSFVFLLVLFVFVSVVSVFEASALSEDVAALAIEEAEGVVASAYEAVLEAEEAGANISVLVARLNDAGEDLAQAHVSYRVGDFEGAARFADLCREIGEGVRVEALGLRNLAVLEAVQRFWWTMTMSIMSAVTILCLSLLGWRIFKRRYFRRVLGMRPKVVSSES